MRHIDAIHSHQSFDLFGRIQYSYSAFHKSIGIFDFLKKRRDLFNNFIKCEQVLTEMNFLEEICKWVFFTIHLKILPQEYPHENSFQLSIHRTQFNDNHLIGGLSNCSQQFKSIHFLQIILYHGQIDVIVIYSVDKQRIIHLFSSNEFLFLKEFKHLMMIFFSLITKTISFVKWWSLLDIPNEFFYK